VPLQQRRVRVLVQILYKLHDLVEETADLSCLGLGHQLAVEDNGRFATAFVQVVHVAQALEPLTVPGNLL
jgi:hypothetical protein